MIKRLMTSFIGIIVFFCLLPASVPVFSAAILAVALIANYEMNSAVTKNNLLKIAGLVSALGVFFGCISDNILAAIVGVFVLYIILSVFMYGKEKINNIYLLGFTSVTITLFLSTLVLLKREYTAYAAFLPFLFAWITDTGAYFTGCSIGKHKLAKTLSPKKTIEGSIGGIVLCVICSIIYVVILKNVFNYTMFGTNEYLKIVVISFFASVISQIGDLALSAIKRDYEIKDYGSLLPGHGGVLDRFDSVLFVTPFVYYLMTLMM